MITCTTTLTVKEGKEEVFERLLKALVKNVQDNEPGTTLFQFVKSQTSPRKYLVIEEYADQDALTSHSKTEYLKTTVQEMLTYLEEDPILESFDPVE